MTLRLECVRMGTVVKPSGDTMAASSAMSQSSSPAEAAITKALTNWTRQFNTGSMGNLMRSLTDRSKNYSYSLQIKEVFVSGDLAVVRLMWTR
jgi:hypothetical protein